MGKVETSIHTGRIYSRYQMEVIVFADLQLSGISMRLMEDRGRGGGKVE